MDSVNVKWNENMSFTCEIDGHKIEIDAKPESGGQNKGPRPKPLILAALGGCTGIDLTGMLKKMRVNFDSLNVRVDGDITEEHPKHYYQLLVSYELTGENIDVEKVKKAISLSEEKYCGVSFSLKQSMKISNQIVINGEIV
jgi:putative redox protein